MKRVYILIAIVVIVPLLLVGALFFLLANPVYYQPTLVSTFKDQTGFELDIKQGSIHWRYWPPVALTISDVKVRPPGAPTPLASVKHASVGLRLWPLVFGKKVAVDGISVDGMTLNAMVDKSGKANWETAKRTKPAAPAKTPAPITSPAAPAAAAPASRGGGLDLEVQRIDITDSTVNYQDVAAGTNYAVSIPAIRVGAVGYDKPVPVDLSVHVDDKAGGMHVDLDAKGEVTFDRGFNHIGFSKLDIHPILKIPGMKDIDTKLRLEGSYDVQGGKFTADVDGSVNSSHINGKFGADLARKTSANFDVKVDQLKASEFLTKAPSKTTSPASSAPPQDMNVLPLDMMNRMNIHGKFGIGKLNYASWTFSDVTLNVDNKNQKLQADISVKGYDGTAKISFVGSSAGRGAGHTNVTVSGIDITKLTDFTSITGKVNLNSNTTFTGHMLSSIMNSLDGTTTFDVTDGTLDVRPLKRVASLVDTLRGKGPSGVANWPDKMPFKDLKGMHRFVNGTKKGQQFSFALENMNATGSGGFDYFKSHLAYDIAVSLKQSDTGPFKVSAGIANVKWPLHCEGSFSDSPADMCRPDKEGIQKAIGATLKQKAEESVKQKVEDKLKGLFNR